jgi:hypothetical protein
VGRRGEHDAGATWDKSHPSVGAASVDLQCPPGVGLCRRTPSSPRPDPRRLPGGRGQQALPGDGGLRVDVLPEPRPSHVLGAGARRSGGRHRRRRPGERSRRRGDGGRALPARLCRCRVAHTCRDKARAPLEGGCNNLWFCKILLKTTNQTTLICMLFVLAVCSVTNFSLVLGPPGM